MLIGMSFSYSQYQVKVEWDATDINCTCGVGIDSAFQITVYIRDIANEEDSEDEEKNKPRKDHFQVPVNSDFDLYSMGRDGQSRAPFTAEASYDDIVRASDGRFIGLVTDF